MTTNGPLTTAEAAELLGVHRPQLYRWKAAGYLTARKINSLGTGILLWDREPLEQVAAKLPPLRPGHTRQARSFLKSPS